MSLRFPPHMTLQAAARIAHEHGYELLVRWDGKHPQVDMIRVRPPFQDPGFLPSFLQDPDDAA